MNVTLKVFFTSGSLKGKSGKHREIENVSGKQGKVGEFDKLPGENNLFCCIF